MTFIDLWIVKFTTIKRLGGVVFCYLMILYVAISGYRIKCGYFEMTKAWLSKK